MHILQAKHTAFLLCLIFSALVVAGCLPTMLSEDEAEAKWRTSAHADIEARSFNHWNDSDTAEVPERCAKCHSTAGYLDFLGVDGSTAGQVDQPAPIGSTIECEVCHNDVAENKQEVLMPSGLTIEHLKQESNCMECHQGRASAVQVAEAVADRDPDVVDTELSLPNIHNNAAAPTFYGTNAMGGGEYVKRTYLGKFVHGTDDCTTCHDAHTLEVRVANCSACHLGATDLEGVRNIRLRETDYDGDGNIREGLLGEIETMHDNLGVAMRLYTIREESIEPIEYDGRFRNEAGDEYSTWTPRLLQAAYNYAYVAKDPGSYAHNPRYILQLLYDSIDDLGGNTDGMTRPSQAD